MGASGLHITAIQNGFSRGRNNPGLHESARHLLTFTPQATQTEFSVTEFGYTDAQVVEMSRLGMEQCLDKLAAAIA